MRPSETFPPCYVIAGAPGAGKTAVLPELVRLAEGIVVIDMDELLEDGALLGVPIAVPEAAPIWPAYDRMWRRIAGVVRRAGHPVLLLRPTPSPGDFAIGDDQPEPVHWLHLDCADQTRRTRLQTRGWPADRIEDANLDAAQAREVLPTAVRTDDENPEQVARRILDWAAALSR